MCNNCKLLGKGSGQSHIHSGSKHYTSTPSSPGDELEVVPVSSELMFVPQLRKFTVSEGMATL